MTYLDELYNIPIKAISIDKRNHSKKGRETHEIFVSQSSDFCFAICEDINGGECAVSIGIPPEKLEVFKKYVDEAVDNYKKMKDAEKKTEP